MDGPSLVMILWCPTRKLSEDDDEDGGAAGDDDHNKDNDKENDNKKEKKHHQCNNQPVVKELNSYRCWCGCRHADDTAHSRRFASRPRMAMVSGAATMKEAYLILFVIDSFVSQFFCSRTR